MTVQNISVRDVKQTTILQFGAKYAKDKTTRCQNESDKSGVNGRARKQPSNVFTFIYLCPYLLNFADVYLVVNVDVS